MARLGKNSATAGTNIPKEMKEQLKKLADASGLTLSAYIAAVLSTAAKNGDIYKVRVVAEPSDHMKVAEDQAPYNSEPGE